MYANAPALFSALGVTTEDQRQQLVTKTHPQQLLATLIEPPDVVTQGQNPGVGTKGVGLTTRNQICIVASVLGRVLTVDDVVDLEVRLDRLFAEQLLEHVTIAFVLVSQLGAKVIGL